MPLGDWLGYKLSGEVRGERSALTEIGLMPIAEDEEPDGLLELVGVDADLLPKLSRAGEQTGEVTDTAARATGLEAGTPLIAGGPDTQVGLLGMGVTEPGEMGVLMGWSGPLQMVTRETRTSMRSGEHGRGGTWWTGQVGGGRARQQRRVGRWSGWRRLWVLRGRN